MTTENDLARCARSNNNTDSSENEFYGTVCEPYLETERDRLGPVIDSFARKGKNVSCAKQQFTEAKWYIKAHMFSRALDTFKELERDLNSEAAQNKPLLQDDVGSYGACFHEWFFKVDASLDTIWRFTHNKQPLPVYPKFLDEVDSPEKLKKMFGYYLNPSNGLEPRANAKALNSLVTGLVPLLYRNMPVSYKWHPELEKTMKGIIDDWQDKNTGLWGVKEKKGDQEIFFSNFSITFHIVNLRQGDVNHLPQIADTLLKEKSRDHAFLDWCYEDDRFSHHHAYDIVTILRYAWPKLSPEVQKKTQQEIKSMLAYSLDRIMQEKYDFDDANGDEINESVAYHVFFLEATGFFESNLWWTDTKDPQMPRPVDVAKKIMAKIDNLNTKSDLELSNAAKILLNFLRDATVSK
ncbi:MAG: hypothetical protein HQM16_03105 [Deltaproteobacteria bacterium]|nr:hypothetical protein [Deltaproteobacteria bacterium]